ncbi:SPL family radical SAM protein [Pelobacter propionicus]|uniref:Radical SAM domain protein n=1 Tax=Pelobacter propionicus (strain DSM 2379 / NBRC 103807 / OttBd1) TaxID=338966 RepID=A1AKE8_PELPD|nr:radical SAM protein [Pelobacter propionicus]ABK97818.1 Radical SAM domain protein [Pelobacter propionicus DSM 2379]
MPSQHDTISSLVVREIQAKSILSVSKIYSYVINPYVGCQHACSYCYARYMKKFTGHKEPWGTFVDVKINAAELLQKEIGKKKKDSVWISGVCDPYQPLEAEYRLTRRCLQILADYDWPVVVQTRSPLVLRDIDIFKVVKGIEVGFSVTTADDNIRKLFEPHAPSIAERLNALAELHRQGIRTYAMIAPLLPGAESLVALFDGSVDYILVDRMNYHYADAIYRSCRLEDKHTEAYFTWASQRIKAESDRRGIECTIV